MGLYIHWGLPIFKYYRKHGGRGDLTPCGNKEVSALSEKQGVDSEMRMKQRDGGGMMQQTRARSPLN